MFFEIQGHLFNVSEVLSVLWDTNNFTVEIRFKSGHVHNHAFDGLATFVVAKGNLIDRLTKQ